MMLNSAGEVSRLGFGASNEFLTGSGTWATMATATGWTLTSGKITTTNKIGIGISNPTMKLECDGSAAFTGTVYAEHFSVADASMVQGTLSFTSNMILNGYDPIAGKQNEVYTTTQPYFVQSAAGYNNNTYINYNNTGKVGIGTNAPTAKLHVQGSSLFDGDVIATGKSRFHRIAAIAGDSIIRFGDSTIHMNTTTNTIYGSPISSPFTVNKGLGLGSYAANGKGQFTVAIGWQSHAIGDYSNSMGYFVKSNAQKAITIGSGTGSSGYLVNSTANSLMVGFNSNIPTLFIGPSAGVGKVGLTGLGTATPDAFFHIKNVNPAVANGYTVKIEDASNSNGLVVSSGNYGDPNGGDLGVIFLCKTTDNKDILRVRSSGKTYAREILVNLNTSWPDYVFDENYKLNDLEKVADFVKENNHLPGVPSAAEVEKEGINVAEMDAVLLKKIEELTLYLIELKKENQIMKAEIEKLQNK